MQQQVVAQRLALQVGAQMEVVVEGYHPESRLLMVGRHRGLAPEIDGVVIINEGQRVRRFGKRYLVEITGVAGYDLIGRVLGPSSPARKEPSSPLAVL